MANPIKSSFEIVIILFPFAFFIIFHFSYSFEIITLTNSLVFTHTDSHFIFRMGFSSLSMFVTFWTVAFSLLFSSLFSHCSEPLLSLWSIFAQWRYNLRPATINYAILTSKQWANDIKSIITKMKCTMYEMQVILTTAVFRAQTQLIAEYLLRT